jgi:hypothetical protein
MIKPIINLSVEVIPQAIINLPVSQVVGKLATVTTGSDDLDTFEGASFKLDSKLEIAVRHYRGYPDNTATIYIDREINDVDEITVLIRKILSEFHLTEDKLSWERARDPDL